MEFNTQGIILKAQDTKEADRLYYIFSLEKGLVRAFAKSVKTPKSKLAGFLTVSNQVFLMLAQNELSTKIAQVSVIKTYPKIINSYAEFFIFNQIAEILLNFLRENQVEEYLYNSTKLFLDDLNSDLDLDKKKNLQLAYLGHILNLSGFKPADIKLNSVLVNFLNTILRNDYLKNRDLMIKLRMSAEDFKKIINYLSNYFQNILDKELNSFVRCQYTNVTNYTNKLCE